jgi:hypothetical protein
MAGNLLYRAFGEAEHAADRIASCLKTFKYEVKPTVQHSTGGQYQW